MKASSRFAVALVLFLATVAIRQTPVSNDELGVPTVNTGDVHRFVDAFARRPPADTSCAYLDAFLRDASAGQRAYLSKFDVDRRSLCRAVRHDSGAYVRLASELAALDSLSAGTSAALTRYAATTGSDVQPDVYFVVGNGISAGSTTRGRHPIILIGTERLRSLDRVDWTVTHEFAHTQQKYPWLGSFTGGPAILGPLKGTCLRLSITEGAADFVAEKLTGKPYHNAYGEQHAAELWKEFRRDMHGKDCSRWLYNGANRAARGDRPPDLGYFIGYSIVKAYDENPKYKGRALVDAMEIRDFDRFLEVSGYNPL